MYTSSLGFKYSTKTKKNKCNILLTFLFSDLLSFTILLSFLFLTAFQLISLMCLSYFPLSMHHATFLSSLKFSTYFLSLCVSPNISTLPFTIMFSHIPLPTVPVSPIIFFHLHFFPFPFFPCSLSDQFLSGSLWWRAGLIQDGGRLGQSRLVVGWAN
ncbi:hypothetical protein XENTR_v10005291 [Xenopus tropicalis]|nr:hypothetical protein XENTR_v10005291 [Xenopus tropicalis]